MKYPYKYLVHNKMRMAKTCDRGLPDVRSLGGAVASEHMNGGEFTVDGF